MGTDAAPPGAVPGRVPAEEWGLLSLGAARPPRPPALRGPGRAGGRAVRRGRPQTGPGLAAQRLRRRVPRLPRAARQRAPGICPPRCRQPAPGPSPPRLRAAPQQEPLVPGVSPQLGAAGLPGARPGRGCGKAACPHAAPAAAGGGGPSHGAPRLGVHVESRELPVCWGDGRWAPRVEPARGGRGPSTGSGRRGAGGPCEGQAAAGHRPQAAVALGSSPVLLLEGMGEPDDRSGLGRSGGAGGSGDQPRGHLDDLSAEWTGDSATLVLNHRSEPPPAFWGAWSHQ